MVLPTLPGLPGVGCGRPGWPRLAPLCLIQSRKKPTSRDKKKHIVRKQIPKIYISIYPNISEIYNLMQYEYEIPSGSRPCLGQRPRTGRPGARGALGLGRPGCR